MLSRFWTGFSIPLEAIKTILSSRTLLFWSAFPVSITLALYVLVIKRAQGWAKDSIHQLLAYWGISPDGWVGLLTSGLTAVALLLAGVFTFAVMSSIVASPFNDILAERTERFCVPALSRVSSNGFRHQLRLIWIDIAKSVAAGVAGLFALVISWIPIINVIAFMLAFLLIAFQYLSYAQTRRGMTLSSGVKLLFTEFSSCVGFGMAMSLLFALPFISAFMLPIAVVGGTLLFGRLQPRPNK